MNSCLNFIKQQIEYGVLLSSFIFGKNYLKFYNLILNDCLLYIYSIFVIPKYAPNESRFLNISGMEF